MSIPGIQRRESTGNASIPIKRAWGIHEMINGSKDLEFREPMELLLGVRQKQGAGESRGAWVLNSQCDSLKHLLAM